MTKPTKQHLRNELMLKRLIALSADGDKHDAKYIAEFIELMLDELAAEDFFGTEQQLDPRGDFRTKKWSVNKVEGVDA